MIKIIIEGVTGSGKTVIRQHIEELLQADGFNIHTVPSNDLEYCEAEIHKVKLALLRDQRREIEISERSLRRSATGVE